MSIPLEGISISLSYLSYLVHWLQNSRFMYLLVPVNTAHKQDR